MKSKNETAVMFLCGFIMLLLILDAKTALSGAKEGINLCLQAVLPSIFPFLIISQLLTGRLSGRSIPLLRPIGKLCGIPEGAESIFLLGLLGGYPVGAQSVSDAWKQGSISQKDAHRLLGFCSNAGPAFLFGMFGPLFSSDYIPWILWLIHIISALTVGMVLPGKAHSFCSLPGHTPDTLPKALERSIRIISVICGWVIAFRVILAILNRWLLWFIPLEYQVLLTGLLELSNGCHSLRAISCEATRFIISSVIISAGGLCVGMQTVTVTADLGTGKYFPGKILQSLLSIVIALCLQPYLFNTPLLRSPAIFLGITAGSLMLYYRSKHRKKVVAICG